MNVSIKVLLRGAIWTLGGFGAGQIIRLATNIILARILAPQLFGLMLIVSTVRFGIELMSDIGIGQNIIYSPHANEPEFYNTAWSLQLFRSVGLFLLIVAVSSPLAHFYNSPILVYLLPVTGIMTLLGGLTSVSPQILQKRLQFGRLNLFQLIITIISSVLYIMVVYFHPTIWGMVLGNILGSAATAIGSYFILPEIKQRFLIAKRFFNEIIHFGKWITLSSVVYFLSMNIDRLYFAKVVPLELLGIYGIARSISELLSLMAARLGNGVVFPFVASHSNTPRPSCAERSRQFVESSCCWRPSAAQFSSPGLIWRLRFSTISAIRRLAGCCRSSPSGRGLQSCPTLTSRRFLDWGRPRSWRSPTA